MGSNVSTIFNGWLQQTGYPVLHVETNESSIIIKQKEFLLKTLSTSNQKWNIPISLITDDKAEWDNIVASHLLTSDIDELEIKLDLENTTFYLFNTKQVGYYRVNYDTDNWNAIKLALKNNIQSIHVLNRAQIVDDVFNLAEAGQLDYDFAFDIFEYLTEEIEFQPWKSALNGLARIAIRDPREQLADDYSNLFGVRLFTSAQKRRFQFEYFFTEIQLVVGGKCLQKNGIFT